MSKSYSAFPVVALLVAFPTLSFAATATSDAFVDINFLYDTQTIEGTAATDETELTEGPIKTAESSSSFSEGPGGVEGATVRSSAYVFGAPDSISAAQAISEVAFSFTNTTADASQVLFGGSWSQTASAEIFVTPGYLSTSTAFSSVEVYFDSFEIFAPEFSSAIKLDGLLGGKSESDGGLLPTLGFTVEGGETVTGYIRATATGRASQTAVVPVPSSLVLSAGVFPIFLGLVATRRRRRRG